MISIEMNPSCPTAEENDQLKDEDQDVSSELALLEEQTAMYVKISRQFSTEKPLHKFSSVVE